MNPVVLDQIVRQQEEIEKLRAEIARQTNCIRGLTGQVAALVVEKNSLLMDHGGALCYMSKIEFLEGLLAGDGALIMGLKNELAECQQDAERYRYMRTNARFQDKNGPGLYWYLPRGLTGNAGEKLDAAIDAAMQGDKP